MLAPNFIDYVKVYASSGKGGAGCISFRRAKFIPKGGPDGGKGGKGGDIIVRGNKQLSTLLHLKYKKHITASNGSPGQGASKSGADGHDVTLDIPLGTIVRNAETHNMIAEIVHHGQETIILKGGRGGLGNESFKTSTLQAPRYAQPGEPNQQASIILELKLLADVGLVGLPNAGKSTLLSALSAAKPKVADYQFTTLVPSLGIVAYKDNLSFVMADIPGLIRGAAEGRGLGLRFLRHIERNNVLLYVIDINSTSILETYQILKKELTKYNSTLLNKKQLLAISKADSIDDDTINLIAKDIPTDIDHVFISSHHNNGLAELKDKLWNLINEQ